MKKILSLLIVAVIAVSLMVPTVFASEPIEVTPGQTVSATFYAGNTVTLATFKGTLTGDVADMNVTSGIGAVTRNPSSGKFNVVGTVDQTVGALLTVTGTIPADAQPGDTFTISLSNLHNAAMADQTLVDLTGGGTYTYKVPGEPPVSSEPTEPEETTKPTEPEETTKPTDPEETTKPTTKPTEPKPTKPGKDEQPKNGDVTPYPVFFLLAVMAVAATAFVLKRKFDV